MGLEDEEGEDENGKFEHINEVLLVHSNLKLDTINEVNNKEHYYDQNNGEHECKCNVREVIKSVENVIQDAEVVSVASRSERARGNDFILGLRLQILWSSKVWK